MVMKSLRDGAAGGLLKYILFTILGMAVGGLVLSELSGTNGGVSSNDVAKIEGKTIGIRQFDRTLRRALSRYNMSPEQAYQIGLTRDILASEIRSYFLQVEAENIGVEIDKDHIAKNVAEVVKPNVQDGQSLQETLEDLLRRQGMSEKEFVNGIKRELSGNILMDAVKNSFTPPNDLLAKELYTFQTQTRDIDLILFPDSEIDSVEPATEEQLERLYESTKSFKYKIPEYRSAKIAVFDIAELKTTFSATTEEIKAAYEDNIENFAIGEQFILSQALVKDEKQAAAIYALVKEGKDLKTATIEITKKESAYLENISFETDLMLPALRDALKDRNIGQVLPPVKTTLGHHVVKLVNIIPPSTKPFETVKEDVRKEVLEAKKADYLYGIAEQFDTLLSDETPFEDIAKELDITISSIPSIDATGLNEKGEDGLEIFSAQDKPMIAEMIFELEENTPSPLLELEGKFVAFMLKSRKESTFQPFETVKKELAEQFIADQRRVENGRRMKKYLAELETKGSTLETIAAENKKEIKTISKITIDGDIEAPLNADIRPLIFKTPLNEHEALTLDGQSALIKISGYGFPDMGEEGAKNIEDIKTRLDTESADEAFLMYLHALSEKYDATINDRLLKRVYNKQDDDS